MGQKEQEVQRAHYRAIGLGMLRWKMAGVAEQRHHGKVSEEVDGTGASPESHIWRGSELASHSQSDVKSLEVFDAATPLGLF